MAQPHILIVEDEEKIALLVKDYLEANHFGTTIINRGDQVEAFIERNNVNLVLLDVMLPGKDGLTLCKSIRQKSTIPVIMLTAKVSEIDRLLGLEFGCDDYICKPFSPREVVARVKAVLRRSHKTPQENVFTLGPLVLNQDRHACTLHGTNLVLTPNEFGILRLFMSHPGKVFSRAELLDKVQGYQFEGYERTVDSHVKNLRKKINAIMPDIQIILSVYGIGYKLNENALKQTSAV
ncbi:MAG: response regulator [Desulfobacterales bacterium]|nr:response regulator [Desulfobacterales bacterium]